MPSAEHRRGAPRLTTLGAPHLAVVGLSVLVLIVLLGIMIYPSLYDEYIKQMGIQQFESQYSFRTGVVTVPAYRDQPAHTEWGIVSVSPEGRFHRLGVRAGDILFAYHGGVADMYNALQHAAQCGSSSFEVSNAADKYLGRKGLRIVNLPPFAK